MVNKLKQKKGQSTLEYIILVTAVIVVIILFMANNNSPFKVALNDTLGDATEQMTNSSGRIQGVFATTP